MQDEQVTFKVFKATPQPSTIEECFKIETKGKQVVKVPKEEAQKLLIEESNQPKSTKSNNTKIGKQGYYLKVASKNQLWKKVKKCAKNNTRPIPTIHDPP